jgi:hypothetical protein
MQKPLLENLQNDIDNLINASIPFFYSSEELQALIIDLLEETYTLLNKLEEARFKYNLSKLEHDRDKIQSYIDQYKTLQEKAIEQEDEDLASRYGFAHGMYELFQQKPSSAIAILRLNMIAMEEAKNTPEFKEKYLLFLKEHKPDEYNKKRRHLLSLDLMVDIFNHLESYQIDKKTILKSASLRLFNFFNTVTYGQKRTLAKNIEHLFAPLGENISVDPKRADKIRNIGKFQTIDLFDYQSNQKVLSKDIDINEMFIDLLPKIAEKFKENGFDRQGDLLFIQKEFLELQKILSFLKP